MEHLPSHSARSDVFQKTEGSYAETSDYELVVVSLTDDKPAGDSQAVGQDAAKRKIIKFDPKIHDYEEALAAGNIGMREKANEANHFAAKLFLSELAYEKHGEATNFVDAETGEERTYEVIEDKDGRITDLASRVFANYAQQPTTTTSESSESSDHGGIDPEVMANSRLARAKITVKNDKKDSSDSDRMFRALQSQLAANAASGDILQQQEKAREKERLARDKQDIRDETEDQRDLKHSEQQRVATTAVDNPEPVDTKKTSTRAVDKNATPAPTVATSKTTGSEAKAPAHETTDESHEIRAGQDDASADDRHVISADHAASDIRSDDIDTQDKTAAPTESKSKIHKMDQPTHTEILRERKRTQKTDEAGPAAAA